MQTPRWPAVIKYRGDNELQWVADEDSWQEDRDLSGFFFDDSDRLIDSTGRLFRLPFDHERGCSRIVPSNELIPLEQFTRLIQAHLFSLAQTCLTGVVLKDFAEGIATVRDT